MKMNRVASFDVLRTLCMYLIVLMHFITIDTRVWESDTLSFDNSLWGGEKLLCGSIVVYYCGCCCRLLCSDYRIFYGRKDTILLKENIRHLVSGCFI